MQFLDILFRDILGTTQRLLVRSYFLSMGTEKCSTTKLREKNIIKHEFTSLYYFNSLLPKTDDVSLNLRNCVRLGRCSLCNLQYVSSEFLKVSRMTYRYKIFYG